MVAAAIRSNNPGAMWGNRLATKWGATKAEVLHDGLGQGNNIAYFPTKFQGACAQMDLWRTSYVGMTFAAADRKWSGGNSDEAYVKFLCSKVPGLTPGTLITTDFLRSDSGWKMMKYQAQWESGQPYPGMTDADWQRAQSTVFSGKVTNVSSTKKKVAASTGVVVATTAAANQASVSGVHWVLILVIVVLGITGAAALWFWIHRKHEEGQAASPVINPDRPRTTSEIVMVTHQPTT